jgi:hypothetical protein
MTTCYLCGDGDGAFPHADKDARPLGLACPRCHQIVMLAGEDPAAIDRDRLASRLRTIADNRHEHGPGPAAQRATIAIARAALTGNPGAAVEAAATVPCPVCLGLTVTHYWIAVYAIMRGNRTGLVTDQVRRELLAAADAADAELRSAPN